MQRLRTQFKHTRSGTALVILIVGLVLSSIAALFAYRAYDTTDFRRFSESSSEVRDSLETRTQNFEKMVLQVAGLYSLSPDISPEEWRNYVGYAGLPRNDRGVYTFGIFKKIPSRSGVDEMIIQVHEVNPYLPYKAASPGTNISQDEVRMRTIRMAAEEARPRLSPMIFGLAHLTGKGFMLTAPAYRNGIIPPTSEERRKQLIGVSYLRFSEGGLFDIFQYISPTRTSLDVEVFSGTLKDQTFARERILYDRFPEVAFDSTRKTDFEINVGGTPFTVRIFSVSNFGTRFGATFAGLILFIGATLSFIAYRVIRSREQKNQRLLHSERQLKLVTDALPVMVSYIEPTSVFRLINKAYEDFFGKPRPQILGKTVQEVVGSNNFAIMDAPIEKALKGETISSVWTLTRPSGEKRDFEVILMPDMSSATEVKGVIMMWTDITDRHRSEDRAKFLGEFSTVLAASLDPLRTSEKVVSLVVPKIAEWCTIDLTQADGSPETVAVSGYVPASTDVLGAAEQAIKTGAIQRETEVSGHTFVSIPLRSADGILGAFTFGSAKGARIFQKDDVLFAIEVALRASLAIQNATLYSESQALNRAKDNFLAMLSHELRTPMNVILGWLEILTTEDVDDATYAQALDTLNRNASVQIQLISELLDVSRIINGKLTVEPKFCDIGEIAEVAIASVRPAAQAKQIECSLTKSGDLETLADPERVQQILWNLLSNALKFTPSSGAVKVEVVGLKDEITLKVTDSGVGIEKSFLPFVFDRFRQEESAFAKQAGGLGLGLSIVRYLAEAHGGSIVVTSEGRGQGASFTLTLPRA